MKLVRFVLKLASLALIAAAAVCFAVAYWDRITETVCRVKEALCCKGKCPTCSGEFDDYADWDMD